MPTTIRKLNPDDYEAFYRMRIGMLESSAENYTAGLADWKNASKEQVMFSLKEGQEHAGNFVLGAFQDELIGMVGFRRESRVAVRHKGSIWGLFENPLFEKQNVGIALLQELIRIVSKYDDFEYIRTVQNVSSVGKIDFFLKLGFKQYGLEERSMRVGQSFFDQAYLRLDTKA